MRSVSDNSFEDWSVGVTEFSFERASHAAVDEDTHSDGCYDAE